MAAAEAGDWLLATDPWPLIPISGRISRMETERDAVERPNHRPDGAIGGPLLPTATEWLIDAADCDPTLLSSLEHLQRTCDAVVDGLHLRVIGEPHWHRFPTRRASPGPGGVTGLYLLAESHLTCHTFPEDGLAAFNLYCCRGCVAWDWQAFLREWLGAGTVVVRSIMRGDAVAGPPPREERP
jgi:S-adenosylmethionine decarboxylase